MWEEAEKFLGKDKYIGPLVKKYGPCPIRPRKSRDYFVSLVREIVNQQLADKAAHAIFARVKDGLKEITPSVILATPDQNLRNFGMAWSKVKYLKDLSQKVESGKLQIHELHELSDEEVMKELIAVKGIGRWTAEMFLMFTLGRPDIFPDDDLGIKNGMKKLIGKSLDADKMTKFALRWKPFRTVASWYIWSHLDG